MDTKRFVVSLLALAGIAVGAGSSVASGQVTAPPAAGPTTVEPAKPAPSTVGTAPGEDVTLIPGQEAKLSTKDVTVRFTRLVSDSRCPPTAICVWAGDATVELMLREPGRGESTKVELHTGLGLAREEARFAGTRVELLDVARDGSKITVRIKDS